MATARCFFAAGFIAVVGSAGALAVTVATAGCFFAAGLLGAAAGSADALAVMAATIRSEGKTQRIGNTPRNFSGNAIAHGVKEHLRRSAFEYLRAGQVRILKKRRQAPDFSEYFT
jgi:hypothetical protein